MLGQRRSEQQKGGCLFKRLSILEENRLAICWAPVTPLTQGAMDILTRFSCLTSHQNWYFFHDVKERVNFSRRRYFFLRLRRQRAYLNLLFVLRLMLKRTPAEGQPASTQTLSQKVDISLNFLVPSFQPGLLGGEVEEGETQGKHKKRMIQELTIKIEQWN